MNSYKDLIVWKKSIELVIEIYKITDKLPKSEIYGLTSQMRRSAVSIPSNIAEGYARKNRKEYAQFIRISFGSGAELETQIIISKNLKLIDMKNFEKADKLLDEIMRMLNKFITSLVAKP